MKTVFVLSLSFLFALILSLLPLPHWIQYWRPEWAVMVFIFWVMMMPNRVGLWTGWFLGLLIDILNGTLLGEHALAFVLVGYLTLKFYRQLRFFPFWQQAVTVMILVFIYQATLFIIQGISGQIIVFWQYWMATVTSFIFWPWLYILLYRYQKKYQIE